MLDPTLRVSDSCDQEEVLENLKHLKALHLGKTMPILIDQERPTVRIAEVKNPALGTSKARNIEMVKRQNQVVTLNKFTSKTKAELTKVTLI